MRADARHLPEASPRSAKRLSPLQIELIQLLARAAVEEFLAEEVAASRAKRMVAK
ncbi:MAG: hypothetical protein NW202_13080 [Nitrospira sp.]|nr:hypothetical protein [Nitrospira sp.]